MGLSFGQVQAALMRCADIHPTKEKAFEARVKQWQKAPHFFPKGTNTGKGRRADYGAAQFFQLAFAVELQSIGLPPDRAILVTETMWERVLRTAVYDVLVCKAGSAHHRHHLAVQLDSFGGLRVADHAGKLGFNLDMVCFTSRDLEMLFREPDVGSDPAADEELTRQRREARFLARVVLRSDIVIEMDTFVLRLLMTLKDVAGDAGVFADEIRTWGATASQSTSRFHGPVAGPSLRELEPHFRESLSTESINRIPETARAALALKDRFEARRLEPDGLVPPSHPNARWSMWQADNEEEERERLTAMRRAKAAATQEGDKRRGE